MCPSKKRKLLISKTKNHPSLYQELYAISFDQSPVGLIIYDIKGRLIKANSAALQVFGLKKPDYLKKHSFFQIPFYPKITLNTLKKGETKSFEATLDFSRAGLKKSGKTETCLRFTVSPLRSLRQKFAYFLVNVEDIGEQIKNRKMLEDSERMLDTILRASPVGIGLVTKARKMGWCNDLLLKMIGYRQEDVLGKDMRLLYDSQKEYQRVGKELYCDMKKRGIGEIDTVWKKKDGSLFDVHIHVRPISPHDPSYGIITGVMDITDRKKAEENIRKSDELLSNIFSSITDPFYIVDKNYKIIRANAAAARLRGYSSEKELVGKTCYLCLHKRKAPCPDCPGIATLETLKPAVYFHQELEKGGNLKWTMVQSYPIFDDAKNLIQVVIYTRDITQRKKIEERQNLTMEILHRLNQGGHGKDVLGDILSLIKAFSRCFAVAIRMTEENGRYYAEKTLSPRLLQLDSKGSPHLQCLCGDVLSGRTDAGYPFFTPGGSFWTNSLSTYVKTLSDDALAKRLQICLNEKYESMALIPLKAEGKIVGLLQIMYRRANALNSNIIEFYERLGESIGLTLLRIHDSQLLAESEQFLSSIIDQSAVSMWVLSRQGTLVKTNHACLKLFHINDPEQIVGKYNIFHDEVFQEMGLTDELKKVYDHGKIVQVNIDYDFRKVVHVSIPTSKPLILDITAFPVKGSHGKVSYSVVMHRDITELSHLEKQLRQAHKMEAIGRLAGGVAHDFNNILEIISGHVDLARISEDKTSAFESLDIIQQAVKRAADLTAKLLGYAREGKYKTETIDARMLLEDVYVLISQTFDKRIVINLNIAPGHHVIECDKGQIEQSLLNLCLNAKDAMPEGGELTMEVEGCIMDTEFVKNHTGAKEGNYVVIRVKDTGWGISDDIKPHIFEPFFTTKEKSYHSGMGLSMVYGIVKNHDGYIDATSEAGTGTTFEIFLPMIKYPKISRPEAAVQKKARKKTASILFIDDEILISSLIKKILEANGYTVFTAQDGFAAENILKENMEKIDLIILDLILPHISGREAFERLHKMKKDIPIVVSSGFSLNEDSQQILNMGAFEYLQKPFDLVKLLQTVQDALNRG
ncbi:MAG: PAS domain S-box protein [Candidatus Aureabacteria bacterium]|nr:PAS domain S-box protein [Candidatus Auribacterota bacterium]